MSETFTFYIQPWYRKSPYFEATKRAGCRSWGLYNHMLLPTLYDDPITEYWALLNGVTRGWHGVLTWPAGRRTMQASGPGLPGRPAAGGTLVAGRESDQRLEAGGSREEDASVCGRSVDGTGRVRRTGRR